MFGRVSTSEPQEAGRTARGSVVSLGTPISQAEIRAYDQKGNATVQITTTAENGSYRFEGLPPGSYIFKVDASGFYTAEVHDVRIDAREAKLLPPIDLHLGLIADCGISPHPEYYRLLSSETGSGALSGSVKDQRGRRIVGATVKFVVEGKGTVAVQKTASDGTLAFPALQVQKERCWITVEREVYFTEEVSDPNILQGFESVGAPVTLESCKPGHCQPYLKTVRVMPPCE